MNINDFDTKGTTTSETVIGNPTPLVDPNLELSEVAEILKADTTKNSKELKAISDFIKKDNPNAQMADIAWGVRELLLRLGTPKFGESNLDRLYQYVFLRSEKEKIDNRLNILSS